SSTQVLSSSAGDTVTLRCSDETSTIRNLSNVTLITWKKENGSHALHFVSDLKREQSNFTNRRISFLNAQFPPVLQIRDAQDGDAGHYSCKITLIRSGIFEKSWTLQMAESRSSAAIYISSSVSGVVVILMLIAGIVYCKFYSKRNIIPSQIHQTSPENNTAELVYDNNHEEYVPRFNTLYDKLAPKLPPR
ncbi:hypothetical protein PRIEUP_LOCUS788, partial [Pristimantis euphronides]